MLFNNDVHINTGSVILNAKICVPENCKYIIIFANADGKYSPRCLSISNYFNQNNIGTVLFNLLLEKEDSRDSYCRYDIYLLTKRLMAVTKWVQNFPDTKYFPIVYYATNTGTAAALESAARLTEICAIVSRDGRPDMTGDSLQDVEAPTLLIVNTLDHDLLSVNIKAYNLLRCLKDIHVIDNKLILFNESELNQLIEKKASIWFERFAIPIFSE